LIATLRILYSLLLMALTESAPRLLQQQVHIFWRHLIRSLSSQEHNI
jgi:hypothetical protein